MLAESGFRKLKVKYKKDYIIVSYSNFAREKFKDFRIKLPKKFRLNDEFIYFFGLWCGDRAGGKRFGICNKNRDVIRFTEYFLNKNYQNIEKILYISKNLPEPDIYYNKKFIIDKKGKGWVLSVHSNNGILSSFFYYLLSYLEEFLTIIDNKSVFFAGLFDAEGNVSLYNKSFRWACKNLELVSLYSRFLKQLDLFHRYDGSCIVSYNKKTFYSKIFPYLKHKEKSNLAKFLCKGEGLPKDFIKILHYLKNHPDYIAKDIAKALKRNKVYSELKLLSDFNFILYRGYPHKFMITTKGLKSLGGAKS